MACIESLGRVASSKLPKYIAVEDNKSVYTLKNWGIHLSKLVVFQKSVSTQSLEASNGRLLIEQSHIVTLIIDGIY